MLLAALLTVGPFALSPSLSPRAQRRLAKVHETLADAPWVLVDGNNVRWAVGCRLTAQELTASVDEWASQADGLDHRVVTVWDHGDVAAFSLPHSAAIMSGEAQVADDVIVQLAGFITEAVVVFSSDSGLIGRCHAQRAMQEGSPAPLTALHSLYLGWILEAPPPRSRAEQHGAQSPREGREVRRQDALALMAALRAGKLGAPTEDATGGKGQERLSGVVRWLDGASPTGLTIERTTRSGNLLYKVSTTLDDLITVA